MPNKIKVEYLGHLGDDLFVANCARVSFDKFSDEVNEKDERLIKYLAEHNHWSPFSHCFVQFRITAPICIARQLQKHTVGLSWNEVSRRYVDAPPEYFVPSKLRGRALNKKQGSSEEVLCENEKVPLLNAYATCHQTYLELLQKGVCPEQARLILPQGMQTSWIWSGSLFAFARVVNLRLEEHAQYEVGIVGYEIYKKLKELFPLSCKHLIKEEYVNDFERRQEIFS